jgi:aerotolerance regulator-like protein/VWA domain-containing protein
MTLSFLTPVLLAGCALIAIPIIIHLILKKKPKHLLFPAFRFLQQKHRTTVQKLRLRHLLLLAMRILLFLFLCWALARPELSGSSTMLGDDSPVGVVLIFDTSASMEYVHEGKTRLEAAKELATSFLESVPSSSKVAVLDTAESGGQFVSRADGLKQVQNRRIQAYNRPVTASLEEAFRLLAKPPDMPVLLCVFSDRTAASWNADAVGTILRPAKQRLVERLPGGLPAFYVDLSVKEPRNVAITNLSLRQETTTTPLEGLVYGSVGGDVIQFQAVVQVTGASLDRPVLSLVMDNQEVDSKQFRITAKPGETVTETVLFKSIPLSGDVHQGEVRLKSSDSLAADNVRYFSLVRQPREVLILTDRESDADDWRFALEAAPLAITCRVITPQDVPGVLNADKYQAVCLINAARPGADLWETLRKYLVAGGSLVVLPGEECDPEAYNSDAAQAILPAQLKEKVDLQPRGSLAPLNYDHAIMQPFKEYGKTLPGEIRRHWTVQPSEQSSLTILPFTYADAKGQLHSAPLLMEKLFDRSKTPGRVVLFTSAMYQRQDWKDKDHWNTIYQNWLSFALPYHTVRYLLGARDEKQSFQLGEDVRFWLPRGSGLTSYQLAGPQTSTGEIKDRDTIVTVTDARRPGNYKLSAGESWIRHFSVNLNPAETNLLAGRPSPSEIEDLFGPESLRTGQGIDLKTLALARLGHAPKTELLPYLMIGVLVLLSLENLLANRFYRREPDG